MTKHLATQRTPAELDSSTGRGTGKPALKAMPGSGAGPTAPEGARTGPAGTPAIIVLGMDDTGKPHASWFGEPDRMAAVGAAALMKMTVIAVEGDVLADLAARLPQGRVFASGRAFVPFVKATLYDELIAYAPKGAGTPARRPANAGKGGAAATAETKRGEELTGPVKVPKQATPEAQQSATGTAARDGSTEPPTGSLGDGSDESIVLDPKPDEVVDDTSKPTLPADWAAIAVGALVLASEGPGDGWYECHVVEARGDDLFVLRWSEWPELPTLVRHREHIALMHPNFIGQ